MNADQGKLNFAAGIDNTPLQAGANLSKRILHDIGNTAKTESMGMDNAFLKVGKTIGGVFALSQIKQFASQVINLRGEIQSLEMSFQTLAGKTKGDALFKDIRQFAVETPMMMKDLASGAQTMLAFNIEVEKVMPMLKAIGDISMGDAQKFNSLALAFSQMSATGKLMGQDLLQMINAGFNPLAVISEKTGKTIGDLKKEMENGKITVKQVEEAFIAATSEGGKFNGMLANQAQGIKGAQAQLSGAIDDMMNAIGKSTEGVVVSTLHVATELVQNYEQVGRVLAGVIATYGTYRAALMAVTACKGWATASEALHYNWLLLVERAQKMLNATMLSNPYVLVATAITAVVAALISMKTETEMMREKEAEYEKQKQDVIEAEQKHIQEINKLCDVAGDEAVATDTRRLALYQLEKKYPDIFAKYDTEYEKLCNIKKIKEDIATLEGQKSITNPKNELKDVNAEIAKLEAKSKDWYEEYVITEETIRKTAYRTEAERQKAREKIGQKGRILHRGQKLTDDEERRLAVLRNKRASLSEASRKGDVDKYFTDLSGVNDADLTRQQQQIRTLLAKIEMERQKGKTASGLIQGEGLINGKYTEEELKAMDNAITRQINYRKADTKSGNEWAAEKKKAYETARKAYNDYISGKTSKGVKQDDFEKEAKRLKEDMDAKKKEYDEYKPSVNKEGVMAAQKAADVSDANAETLSKEAAARLKQSEDYARRMADQEKDNEFEIRQARIDAMEDGIDKELLQNQLNYDKLKEQNKRRLREMLDGVAEQKVREQEDANPEIFKKRNKDGKLEDDPGARDKALRDIRKGLTVDSLTDEQKKQYEEFGNIASSILERANKESLKKMLADVLTYEQQRTAITEEYAKKRQEMYEKETYTDADGKEQTRVKEDAEGKPILRKGVTQGNIDELNRQENEALKGIDEQFASREESYKAWCDGIANITLDELRKVLEQAKKELDELEKKNPNDPKLAQARAKVNTAQSALDKAEAKDDVNKKSPKKRTIKEWQDLYKTLNDVRGSFETIGETIGGTIGKVISQAGEMTASVLSMIDGIMTLVTSSSDGIKAAGQAGVKSLSAMEKASVILAIISAAMQIAMQIANMFNDDEKKQKEIERLQERIDQLQWELDHQDIGRVQMMYGTAIERLNKALGETRMELASGLNQWQKMMVLSSRASRNQELMTKTAEKLATAYGTMAYTADKALGGDKYRNAKDQLKNIAEQQILIQEQINAEESKKKTDHGKIKEWQQKIEELGQQALELINDMVEDIIGDSSTGIAEELGNAFIEAFQAGEDAAEAWGDKVNDIVADVMKRMLIKKFLEEPLGKIFDKYKDKWFKGGTFGGLDLVTKSMTSFRDDLNAVGAEFATIWQNLDVGMKDMLNTSESTREASQKGIASASQDSVDELNGRATAIQSHTFSIAENTKILLSTTQSILRSVMNIETETNGFGARLGRMESHVKEMNDTLGDIATKGVRLKN